MKSTAHNSTHSSARSLKKALVREGSVVVGEDKANQFANALLVLVKNKGRMCHYHGIKLGDIVHNSRSEMHHNKKKKQTQKFFLFFHYFES